MWIEWMEDRGVAYLEEVDERSLARWTKYLSRCVKADEGDSDGGITRATAWTYYNAVRAYLGWCVTWRDLDANPADDPKPLDAMPNRPSRSSGDQQFWSPEQRQTHLRHLDERAHEVIDEDGFAPVCDRARTTLTWRPARSTCSARARTRNRRRSPTSPSRRCRPLARCPRPSGRLAVVPNVPSTVAVGCRS
ncbi:hypothetical protein G9464_17480 [Halostella sp. JP-L12]|uniref:hypothetical protein n=1 Tax=Halostella TaxID=1843185 RepID=UPI0013CEB28C|nr:MULTISPECIES: hypothetical protein [Halostella]NHN49365.1 hypothetical protein [Halostella sp. JP-L12]